MESTPPLSPQTARPPPTCPRMRPAASSRNEAMVQSPRQPHTVAAKFRRMSTPCFVWATSGWKSRA